MAGNKSLRSAEKAKVDEFYTQLSDIEEVTCIGAYTNCGKFTTNILYNGQSTSDQF